jgi:hypothetical protein
MGHPSDLALGNALDHGVYPELNLTSRDLMAANDYYGTCNACLEGKMIADPETSVSREPVREIGEYISVDLIPAKAATLGGNRTSIDQQGQTFKLRDVRPNEDERNRECYGCSGYHKEFLQESWA